MGFFDNAPRGPSSLPQGGPWDPPRHEFPRVAASALLLARTGEVAVIVAAVWAFREGFTFWVKAPFRQAGAGLQKRPDEQSLHIGVQFADGRKAANAGRLPSPAGSVPAGLILKPHSFGGGPQDWNLSYWVWPLPPAGPVTFVCEWAAYDIPETHAGIDGQLILDAARHSIQIWPNGHG
jgi:hypothetical protein